MDRWGPAFVWLRQNAGLSDTRIAAAFGCSPNAVAQARSRFGRREHGSRVPPRAALPTSRRELGFANTVGRASAEALFQEVEDAFNKSVASGDPRGGSRSLRYLLSKIGNPSSVELLEVAARIHQHRAWLSVHLSYSAHALQEGAKALKLLAVVWNETEEERVRRRLWEVRLVCSLAHLNCGEAIAAERFLTEATEACAEVQGPVGSEHYRQQASIFMQVGNEEDALKELRSATIAAVEVDHLPGDGGQALLLPGVRQAAFLEREWEKARDALEAVGARSKTLSVAGASHLTWALATALDSDSPAAQQWSSEIMNQSWNGLESRGHQSAVFFLLSITPALKLSASILHRWLRWVMHVNPYSSIDPDRSVRG